MKKRTGLIWRRLARVAILDLGKLNTCREIISPMRNICSDYAFYMNVSSIIVFNDCIV